MGGLELLKETLAKNVADALSSLERGCCNSGRTRDFWRGESTILGVRHKDHASTWAHGVRRGRIYNIFRLDYKGAIRGVFGKQPLEALYNCYRHIYRE